MKTLHKIRLIKWVIQNNFSKLVGKRAMHYPTKQYEEHLRKLELDNYINLVYRSYKN